MTRNVWRRAVVVAVLITAVAGPVAVGVASAATTATAPSAPVAAHPSTSTGTAKKARTYSMVHNAAAVPVRTAPRSASAVVRTLKKAGGKVSLACGVAGDRVNGTTTWYRTAGSPVGYVSAAYLHSTHNPAPRIPHC